MRAICIVPEYIGDLTGRGLGGITTYFMNMASGYVSRGLETVVLTGAIELPVGSRRVGPSGEIVVSVYRHRGHYGSGVAGRLRYEVQRELRLARAMWTFRHQVRAAEIPDWQTPFLAPAMIPREKLFMKLHGPSDFVRLINGQAPRRYWRFIDFRERFWAARVGHIEAGAHVLVEHARDNWRLLREVPMTLDPIDLNVVTLGHIPAEISDGSSGEVSIINVGRLEHRKGQHVVCESLALLGDELPPWRLHFVGPDTGTGPGGSSYREYCAGLVPQALRERISWHPPVDLGALTKVYRHADVVLISSLDGNYGYTTLHPLAAGSCVISTLEPGRTDSGYIAHGVDGFLYPSTDAKALASLLVDLIGNEATRSQLRGGARRRAASELDPGVVASRVLRCLDMRTTK